MRKVSFTALTVGILVCAMAWATLSQAAPASGQPTRGAAMKKLAAYLGLTDAQKAQLKTIVQSAVQQAKTIKADTTLSAADKTAKLQALRQTTRQQMAAVLTPAQKQKLAHLRQSHSQG